jgi:hypothetical protein
MVNRIHGHATNMGTFTTPTASTGLAIRNFIKIHITYLTNRSYALSMYSPQLTRRHLDGNVVTLLRYNLNR